MWCDIIFSLLVLTDDEKGEGRGGTEEIVGTETVARGEREESVVVIEVTEVIEATEVIEGTGVTEGTGVIEVTEGTGVLDMAETEAEADSNSSTVNRAEPLDQVSRGWWWALYRILSLERVYGQL